MIVNLLQVHQMMCLNTIIAWRYAVSIAALHFFHKFTTNLTCVFISKL